ncbi:MAG TPA: hypothetical protein QKA14_00350, partial [Candidatus Megaira endosymbiont of Hartmannula sinica]|nr:hypothetical protein [Candidatus Megaera endosymbiont of Hartmannula sinica]
MTYKNFHFNEISPNKNKSNNVDKSTGKKITNNFFSSTNNKKNTVISKFLPLDNSNKNNELEEVKKLLKKSQDDNNILNKQIEDYTINIEILNDKISELEKINQESFDEYKNDLLEKTNEYDKKIIAITNENSLVNLIENKISNISHKIDINQEIAGLLQKFIAILASKISIKIDSDFTKILENNIIKYINKFTSDAKIVIYINPERKDLCKKILLDNLREDLIPYLDIQYSDNIGLNDCEVKYNSTLPQP